MFKYDTHVHTCEGSACASASGEAQAMFYKSRDYMGIIITDHFFNGNTTIPNDLSWEEKVERFCLGYENAKKCGDRIGLDVFFGWEYSYKGSDFLTYGLNKQWLLKNPIIMELDVNSYCDFIRDNGGIIVHAHPFREASYISMIRLLPRKCDGCEIINSNRTELENKMAAIYADNYELLPFAGSDNHSAAQERLNGLAFDKPLIDMEDFIKQVKRKQYRLF